MAAPTTTHEPDLETIEHQATERLDAEQGHLQEDLDQAEQAAADAGDQEVEGSPYRLAVAAALPTIAAAIMVGGVFTGIGGRLYAAVAGLLGVGLALGVARQRKAALANVLTAVGLFAIGLLMVVPAGVGSIGGLRDLVAEASKSGDVLRPPVGLSAGWQAIIGWLMGIVGFSATWLATVVKRPSLGILLPLPVAAIAAISVPEAQQIASGIAALALFALGLGVLSSANQVGDDDERPPLGYEVRKAIKSFPLLAGILVVLYFLAQADILFPDPVYDPTQEPQKPKTVPLTEVQDRVLFEVEAPVSGPWRTGALDVYDGEDWRLPPFAASELEEVPRSGIVSDATPGVQATFTIAGLTGTALPGLPNPVGLLAEGPKLAYDDRTQVVKLAAGEVQAGLRYTITAAVLPSIQELQQVTMPPRQELEQFTEIGEPPPAVRDLIAQAPTSSKWDQFNFLRNWVLENVVASGPGVPKSIDAERAQDMIGGSQEGTPFEIVALQAMLARWVDVPSRIGYGYDGGEMVEGKLQIRPRNGASFPEVYFEGYGWLPVIGTPRQAEPTVADTELQQFDPTVVPSNEISVQLYLPVLTPGESLLARQIRDFLLVAVPVALLLLAIYVLWPAAHKAWIRSRRRSAAAAAGPRARVALAYAEWRDFATDLGFRHPTDTPLMFLDRFVEDEEHTELAWLVTRGLWGDLQDQLTEQHAAAAEELSRSLRRRLAQRQPGTVRALGVVSRLSLRNPYAPETDLSHRRRDRKKEKLRVASSPA